MLIYSRWTEPTLRGSNTFYIIQTAIQTAAPYPVPPSLHAGDKGINMSPSEQKSGLCYSFFIISKLLAAVLGGPFYQARCWVEFIRRYNS